MDRPADGIGRFKMWYASRTSGVPGAVEILAYLNWLEGKHVVEWPVRLNATFLMNLAAQHDSAVKEEALRALAAIAPERRKRVVNLWRFKGHGEKYGMVQDFDASDVHQPTGFPWECVKRNIELEE